MNACVRKIVANDAKWYESNGLMTSYDQCKCEDFSRDTNKHFEKVKIVNFNMIHRQCCGEEVPKNLLKYYQTVSGKSVLQCLTSDQDKILTSAFRTDRDDIFFEQKTIKKHFNKKNNKVENYSLSFKFFLKNGIIY